MKVLSERDTLCLYYLLSATIFGEVLFTQLSGSSALLLIRREITAQVKTVKRGEKEFSFPTKN